MGSRISPASLHSDLRYFKNHSHRFLEGDSMKSKIGAVFFARRL